MLSLAATPGHSALAESVPSLEAGGETRARDADFVPGSAKFRQAYAFARRRHDPSILGPASFRAGGAPPPVSRTRAIAGVGIRSPRV